MKIEVDDAELRMWFGLHPDAPIDPATLARHLQGGRDRTHKLYSFGAFIAMVMERASEVAGEPL